MKNKTIINNNCNYWTKYLSRKKEFSLFGFLDNNLKHWIYYTNKQLGTYMERDSTIYLGGINIRFSTMNRVLPFYLIYAKVVRQQTNFAISQRKSQSEGLPKSVQLTNPRSLSIHSHSYLLALVHNRRRRFSLRSI